MMDSLITAAARALAAGDLLGVLKRVGLREDAPALALRGIAMAQLGDYPRAKTLLRRAASGFGPRETIARARCVLAEAEIALASRDLGWAPKALASARTTLEVHGDHVNAAHARLLDVRRLLLIGRLDEADHALAAVDPAVLPTALKAARDLLVAGIAMRRIRADEARNALQRAELAARQAAIPALMAEVEGAFHHLEAPAARLIRGDRVKALSLSNVEALLQSGSLAVDACRHSVSSGNTVISLARRPVLFSLARALAESWPSDLSRQALVRRAFRAKTADDSHRARLRVEIGRLRTVLRPLATVSATSAGYKLTPRSNGVFVLAPPVDDRHGAVLALLSDEAWSSSALALALRMSPRTVLRALEPLAVAGKVQHHGRGRARRWVAAPLPGFTTTLLLPGPLPGE